MQGRLFNKKGIDMRKIPLLLCLFAALPLMAQDIVIEEIPLEEPTSPQEEVVSRSSGHSNETLDDLYTLIDEQKKALRDFTERMEQNEHDLKLLSEKLERVSQDMSFRLSELETKQNAAPVLIDKKSEKERYDYAYQLLKETHYAQAEEQFLSFLKDFENSDLRPNALYWLGETYYVQRQYEKAVGQFADVFQKYPKSTKAPDALLKMGLSMVSLKKTAEACTAFIALPNEYPKAESSLKKRAEEEATKNKCL